MTGLDEVDDFMCSSSSGLVSPMPTLPEEINPAAVIVPLVVSSALFLRNASSTFNVSPLKVIFVPATKFVLLEMSILLNVDKLPSPKVVLALLAAASSIKVLPKADIVVLAGNTKVFISASTSESIRAPAAVTFAVSVTSALASMLFSFVWSASVKTFESDALPTSVLISAAV